MTREFRSKIIQPAYIRGRRLNAATVLIVAVWQIFGNPSISYATTYPNITPEQIVLNADHIRFPTKGFQVDVKITTIRPEKEPEVKEYRVLSKGNDRTLLMTTLPAIDRGNILLMRDHDLWAFLPNLSQPVRLPLAQKLTGEVANGDLARANFSGDYEPSLVRTEEIEGNSYYVLELMSARRGVTYNRVLYWINQANNRPYKAEFYTLSNRLIKTCLYKNFSKFGGAIRPTQLVMEDALHKGERSIMEYRDMQLRNLPDKIFTKDYLKKLSR